MRTARLKADGEGYYHCMSRIMERQMRLGETEKEKFRVLLRQMAAFCGVNVITYAVMGNHFHLLIEVPKAQELSDEDLLARLAILYKREYVEAIRARLAEYRKQGADEAAAELKQRYTYRMYDVSQFMKTLKQKFTQCYNRKHGRRGTLWEERFKSILLEPQRLDRKDGKWNNALLTLALYIELNAVRAGLVSDPKDYRYCGYGEAVAGGKLAREGLSRLSAGYGQAGSSWRELGALYRRQLYDQGQKATHHTQPATFSREQAGKVLEAGGELSRHELLRCRVRYFTDGVVLGSREFVEGVFVRHRNLFGPKRRTGARKLRHGDWGGLCTVRDLRLAAVSVPAA